jgi:hypothetical protein
VHSGSAAVGDKDCWVTWQQHFRPAFDQDVPLTIEIINASTSDVLASRDVVIPKRAEGTGWLRFGLSALAPNTTGVHLRITAGTTALPCPAGAAVDVSVATGLADYSPDTRGALLTRGRYFFTESGINGNVYERHHDRVIWCETDDVTWWRAENYADVKEVSGDLTLVRLGGGRLVIQKRNGTWLYNLTDNPDSPIERADFIANIGCLGPSAFRSVFGECFFADDYEVYRWDFNQPPQPLAFPAGMRDYLFNQLPRADRVLLEVDTDNRELYLQISPGKLHIYNLDTAAWTEWFTRDSEGIEVTLSDLAYCAPTGTTKRRMYGLATTSTGFSRVAVLTPGAGRDTWDTGEGVLERAIPCDYWLHTIEAKGQRGVVFIEYLDMLHQMTDTTYPFYVRASVNGGLTFTALPTVTIPSVGAVAIGDSEPIRAMIQRGGRRVVISLQSDGHGAGGAASFAFTGITARINQKQHVSMRGGAGSDGGPGGVGDGG